MWAGTAVVLTSELVLLLWIFVIYNRNVHILAALAVLFVAETISVVVILVQSFARLQSIYSFVAPSTCVLTIVTSNIIAPHTELGNFCSLNNEPQFFYWYWLPVLIYNTAIFALFIGKSFKTFRFSEERTPEGRLVERSFINFLVIFAAFFFCCLFWIIGDFALAQIPVGFVLAFSITNSTRLLINIRQAYYSREAENLDKPVVARTIYANQAPPEEWLFELRALKFE
ncbi:hypothetical protein R3P38DRAFT_2828854 [Favolaschia claudopus]|uniref:Uncharacterized protein n=1 Tax=Favolaschia claudopus TaxID=2862362 RepID=A0AAW0ECN9_9AGAR